MLKTEVIEGEMYYPQRQLRVEGVLPACSNAEHFEEYREDAKRMLTGLSRDFNALGVKQVLAAALDIISTREGEDWLRQQCKENG